MTSALAPMVTFPTMHSVMSISLATHTSTSFHLNLYAYTYIFEKKNGSAGYEILTQYLPEGRLILPDTIPIERVVHKGTMSRTVN